MSKKNILVIAVLLVSSIFLAGCTSDDANVEETTTNEVDNVTVVEADQDSDEEVAEEDVDQNTDEVEEDVTRDDSEESEEDIEETEAVVDEDGKQTVGTSEAADNAAIVGYSYEITDGEFIFKWKVRATEEEPYPMVEAYFDSENVLSVIYPSLVKDYVAKDEQSNDLGSLLPTLNWMPSEDGSKYEFEYDEVKEFTLKTVDEGEEGQFIILAVEL